MTKTETGRRRKSRAAARNAKRETANTAAASEAVSPEQAQRLAIRQARVARLERERRRAVALSVGLRDPAPDETVVRYQNSAATQRELAAKLDRPARATGKDGAKAKRDRRAYLVQAKIYDRQAAEARERQLATHREFLDAREIDAQAAARGETLTVHQTEVATWLRDENGALIRKDGEPVLKVASVHAKRRALADVRTRLERFRLFDRTHIAAAIRFEEECRTSTLDPRLIANLGAIGGGSAGRKGGGKGRSVIEALLDAHASVHEAYKALESGGKAVVAAVESIVIHGATSTDAGTRRYADAPRHNAYIATLLLVGLNLLAAHYRSRREAADAKRHLEAA